MTSDLIIELRKEDLIDRGRIDYVVNLMAVLVLRGVIQLVAGEVELGGHLEDLLVGCI